jgi:Fe-S-cluster-containing dehydrogenase component
VDRIYNENLASEDRLPACVRACPTGARHFGDIGNPDSDISRLVAERGGYDLLPQMDYKPVNKYLPPRLRRDEATAGSAASLKPEAIGKGDGSVSDKFFAWLDGKLSD